MSPRPLVFVCGLTLGDYLLWHWSLSANHDVLALISGLTLPPLGLASVLLLAFTLAGAIARHSRRPVARVGAAGRTVARRRRPAVARASHAEDAQASAAATRPSRRIAA